ncbi:hypothetical protein [Endozoicomonas sp.]|uniref:hypothetical protein n=1 Tax=Endozoicomonas sp. TaxID=1892382 RepID=UPI00383B7F92
MIESPENIETWISAASAIAALMASAFAYKSYLLTKKTISIQENEYLARKANISPYLENSYKVRDKENGQFWIFFCVAYSNKSESIDSISQVYLETHYINDSGQNSFLISNHEEKEEKWSIDKEHTKLPLMLQPRTTVSSWYTFKIPKIATETNRIQKYRIVALNGTGHRVLVESYILQEIFYEKTDEKV